MLKEVDRAHTATTCSPIITTEVGVFAERPSQQTVRQRTIRHHSNALFLAIGKNFLLHSLVKYIPAILGNVDPTNTHAGLDLGKPKIRDSYRPRLTLLHNVIKR